MTEMQAVAAPRRPLEEIGRDNARAWSVRIVDPIRSRVLAERCLTEVGGNGWGASDDELEQHFSARATLAAVELYTGDLMAALDQALELLALVDGRGFASTRSSALAVLATIQYHVHHVDEGLQVAADAVAAAREAGDRPAEAVATGAVALGLGLQRRFDESLASFHAAAELADDAGDAVAGGLIANNRACILTDLGRFDEGLAVALDGIETLRRFWSEDLPPMLLETTGSLYREIGDPDRAVEYYGRALDRARTTSSRLTEAVALVGLGRIALDGGDDRAIEMLKAAVDIGSGAGNFHQVSSAHELLSEWYQRTGDSERALTHARRHHESWERVLATRARVASRMLKAHHDIDRARAEQRRDQERNRELEAEVVRRQLIEDDLRTANIRAEAARREAVAARQRADHSSLAKSEFLANMSHDLRTPLNGILGFSQLLKRRGSLGPADAEAVDVIHRSGDHLLRMVSDLLDLARIEANDLAIVSRPVDVRALVLEVLQIEEPHAADRGIELVAEVDPDLTEPLILDPDRTAQVLINLLDNACKFSPRRSTVSLSASISAAPDDSHRTLGPMVEFAVADEGSGIEPHLLDQIFQRFDRGGETARTQPGSGLGLTIARHLAALMDGTLTADSEVGVGSVFRLCLPNLSTDRASA